MATLSNDIELWQHFKKGDRAAFENLYQTYFNVLGSYGFRLTSDKQLIEDAIQDLFIDLWRRKEYLNDPDNVKFYLFRSLRNQLLRNSRNNVFESSENIDSFLDYLTTLSIDQQLMNNELLVDQQLHIQKALSHLSPRQREAIHLRFYQGLSIQQTAQLMELTVQSVSNLLFKAYAVLRMSLKAIISMVYFLF
ncbi:sigma-70 family RNA polymerase sigma factor [Runella sp. MFBS21]|uniref:RNA polymerase sigma factor n=1 Tax=Runella sp. MFBS21 TaxID=3034018 RepID=UPI0023F99B81|nr:sigma-70 family RNA polymerase sigma factor [Runella sp. MFBS21]MDF7816446.1 sigma-70 family RNA polymerase sigma factor [Runella sp. MFBS21]